MQHMSEGDVEISRRARIVRALLMALHATRRLFVTTAFGLTFTLAEGWMFAFIVFAWLLYIIDGALSDLHQMQQRERQMRERRFTPNNVTLTEEQAERIFAIVQEGAFPNAGQPN